MRFFSNLIAGAALIASAAAAGSLAFNAGPFSVEVGKSYTFKYSPAEDATVFLRKGPSSHSNVVGELGSASGGSFTWSVSKDLVNGNDYALEIKNANGDNFWGPIAVGGSAATATPSSSSASASASATKSESSSITTQASASVSPSAHGNTTISSATLSSTASGSSKPTGSASVTSSGSVPHSTGAASALGSSPLALIFGAVAAIAYIQ